MGLEWTCSHPLALLQQRASRLQVRGSTVCRGGLPLLSRGKSQPPPRRSRQEKALRLSCLIPPGHDAPAAGCPFPERGIFRTKLRLREDISRLGNFALIQAEKSLLDAIGGECAGAVTFTHPGKRPIEQATDLDYRVLEDRELAAAIDKLPERPLLAGEEGVRLSLAGNC
jgi:hypothetical protein